MLMCVAVVSIFAILSGSAGKNQHKTLRHYEEQRDGMLAAGVAEDSAEYLEVLRQIRLTRAKIARSAAGRRGGAAPSGRGTAGIPGGGLRGGGDEPPLKDYGEWLAARLARGMGPPPPNQLSAANYECGFMCANLTVPPEGWHTNAPPPGAEILWAGPWGEFEECGHFPVGGMPGWHFKLGNNSPWPREVFVTTHGVVSFDALIDPADVHAMPNGKGQTFMSVLGGEIGFSPAVGSHFWKSVTDSGFIMRWKNVRLLRDTNAVATFEAEGSFLTGHFWYRIFLHPGFDAGILTNFTIGAQSLGVGQAASVQGILGYLAQHNTREVELQWQAFPELDPDAIAGDTTQKLLTDWESITLGLSPVLPDSDGDNIWDIDELVAGLDPLNPDTALSGAVDFDNPSPDIWTDMAARTVPDGLTLLDKIHNRLPLSAPCVTNLTLRGVPEWVETHLYGIADPANYIGPLPEDADGKHRFFKVTVTLHAPANPTCVVWIGDGDGARRILLRDPGQWEVWLDRYADNTARVFRRYPMPLALDITSSDPGVTIIRRASP